MRKAEWNIIKVVSSGVGRIGEACRVAKLGRRDGDGKWRK
jgi:hypothetical protein